MGKFIVLLRGINVGGNNILPMKELVEILDKNGCKNVQTYIQSGNVVLESNRAKEGLAKIIESEIEKAKGFKVNTLVFSVKDFESAAKENPYVATDGKLVHLFFISKTPSESALLEFEKYRVSSENYEVKNKVLYLYAPEGIGRSKLAANIGKVFGFSTTARNWNTVQKLLKLAST